jgi:DNA (cytosine-5)-methyltransferase 1
MAIRVEQDHPGGAPDTEGFGHHRSLARQTTAGPAASLTLTAGGVSYCGPGGRCGVTGPAGRFSVVSLFTGAGGLDTGLDSTGRFDLRACVEIDHQCAQTLRLNRERGLFGGPATQIVEADLSVLDPQALMRRLGLAPGELDLLAGGPPCQAFSTAGRRQSVADPRGTLLWDFLRFVEAFRPRAFLMENVRGLLSAALRHRPIADRPDRGGPPLRSDELPGSVVELWTRDLLTRLAGAYRLDCFEVNAVNYGAPQLRERALFIGNRLGRVIDFPPPTHGPAGRAADGSLLPYRTLADALAGFHEKRQVLMDFSPRKKRYLEMVPPGGNWRTLPPQIAAESMGGAFYAKGGRSGWWRRLSWDLPCPTVVTMPNHASTSMCHPDEVRVLSVGECARVQEFGDGWQFCGSALEQYAQVGNAVPARLGRVAGTLIASHLQPGPAEAADPEVPAFRRIYLSSHVRTRQWFKQGEVFVWDGHGGTAGYGAAARRAR